jgi:hypothetical protein
MPGLSHNDAPRAKLECLGKPLVAFIRHMQTQGDRRVELDSSAVVLALESMYTKKPVLMAVIHQIADLCCKHQ